MAQQPTWRGHRAPAEGTPDAGRPAEPRSRRWLVAAGALVAIALIGGCAVLTRHLVRHDPSLLPQIRVGTCLSSEELAAGSSDVHELDAVPCSGAHDAEVFALRTLGVGESLDAIGGRCLAAAGELGFSAALDQRDLEVRPLALTRKTPAVGDTVACFVRHSDGARMRGAVLSTGSTP